VEVDQVLARLAEGARQTTQADAVAVRLLDELGDFITQAASPGFQNGPTVGTWSPEARFLLDEQALAGEPVLVADARANSNAAPWARSVPAAYRSALCVPLSHAGDSVGTVTAYAAAPDRFDLQDAGRLLYLAELGAVSIVAARAVHELEELEARQAQFIRVATHELRSPVAVAQSLVRGVLKGYAGDLTDVQRDLFGRISRRMDLLESLVNDLLDLAAGKAGGSEDQTPVLLNAAVGRVVLLLQPRADDKGVRLVYQAYPEELIVRGTEEGIDRILVNLVDNAVKYTSSGGAVRVGLQREDGEIRILVSDTGIGIPEKALPHLFEEFYRAPNAKAYEAVGTGLGLAIVRDLVQRYCGRIHVASREGEGTTVTVTFPRVDLDECFY
jgi:signal transduction histidine kinase